MNIISERILADCGFILNSQKAHASEFKHKDIVVYIVPSAQLNLVISPEDYLYLKELGFKKYHNSNLTAFPKESNEGKQEIHYGYTNWNSRPSDNEEQIEPFRKYVIICEGANTETFYFEHLIDSRKQLGIHPLIDMCLWEKTEKDRDISYAKNLFAFAEEQKRNPDNGFDTERDKMIIVFDGDIFEEKVQGYDELIRSIEENDIAAVTNPAFELFLILHIRDSYEQYIRGNESEFLSKVKDEKNSYAYRVLHEITGMNSKKNPEIGKLADNILLAIEQEKFINQDIHNLKGKVSSNIGKIIETIINEKP